MSSDRTIVAALHMRSNGVDVTIQVPGERRSTIRFRTNRAQAVGAADLLVPLALLPAMRIGWRLRIDAEISVRLLGKVEAVQRLYRSWDRTLAVIDVYAEAAEAREGQPTGDAAFFSGGVDSFHTALLHQAELVSLIYVAGFDISVERHRLHGRVIQANRQVAGHLGLQLTEVQTDARHFSARYLTWSEYHGAALAAAAHLCGFNRTHVPGSLSVDSTFPYGSHPSLDPLFSSETVEICYDGYDTNRVAKTIEIASSDVAINHLRVCNTRDDSGYNCGRCEKCLRTLAALRIAGHPGQLPTFPRPLDPTEIAGRRFRQAHDLWRQNLRAARACGDKELAEAIDTSLRARTSTDDGQ